MKFKIDNNFEVLDFKVDLNMILTSFVLTPFAFVH